jgi:hypothetical protein
VLTRPPAVAARPRAATRARRRLAQREYRRRFDSGRMVVAVEVGGAVVEMLVATGWLIEGSNPDAKKNDIRVRQYGTSDDRKKIAKAIAAMLAEAAKR